MRPCVYGVGYALSRMPVEDARQEAEASTVSQPPVEHRRRRRRTGTGRPHDGHPEDRHA